jgi:asparagine N-glycosylation enzyme membrane subunit Stt3
VVVVVLVVVVLVVVVLVVVVLVVVVLVVVVLGGTVVVAPPSGIHIRFLPTSTQTWRTPPISHFAPTLVHLPAAAGATAVAESGVASGD